VPAGLAGRVCRAAFTAAGTGGIAGLIVVWLASVKAKLALGFLSVAAIVGLIIWNGLTGAASGPPRLARAMSRDTNAGQRSMRTTATNEPAAFGDALAAAGSVPGSEQASLRLRLVADDSGEPVPEVEVRCRYDVGAKISYPQLLSDGRGRIDAAFPRQVTRVEFLTQVEGFADTRLVWRPEHGEVIPVEYVLRLARAVPIGGRVVDAKGTPVSGATVEGFCPNDSVGEIQCETHVAEVKGQTDAMGRWQNRRVAPELIRSLRLQASHAENGPSEPVNVSSDAAIERQLREGIHTLRLSAAVVVSGWVLDPENNPIADAAVLLGELDGSDAKRTSASDGSFLFSGVPAGNHLLTGNAEEFATTTVQIEVRTNSGPVRLVLSRGKPLRVRVTDLANQPIAQARVWVIASQPASQQNGECMDTAAPVGRENRCRGARFFYPRPGVGRRGECRRRWLDGTVRPPNTGGRAGIDLEFRPRTGGDRHRAGPFDR
jgi:protocatechuate 3,4-dioxygenase beta subunit